MSKTSRVEFKWVCPPFALALFLPRCSQSPRFLSCVLGTADEINTLPDLQVLGSCTLKLSRAETETTVDPYWFKAFMICRYIPQREDSEEDEQLDADCQPEEALEYLFEIAGVHFKVWRCEFFVDRVKTLGSGEFKTCASSLVKFEGMIYNAVAKRPKVLPPLSFYITQSQLYLHAERLLASFQKEAASISTMDSDLARAISDLKVQSR